MMIRAVLPLAVLLTNDFSASAAKPSSSHLRVLQMNETMGDSGSLEPVKISIQPAYHGIPVFLGVELGLFEAMGLDVELSVWSSGGPQVEAAADEDAWDFGVAGSIPNILASFEKISTVGISNDESAANQVVGGPGVTALPESGPLDREAFRSAFAVTPGSTAHMALLRCLEANGIRYSESTTDPDLNDNTPSEIVFLTGNPSEVIEALEDGDSLYGGLWAPNSYVYLDDNENARELCNAKDVGVTIPGGLMIRDEWGEENPVLAAKTLAVYLHGVTLMQNMAIRDQILEYSRKFYDFVELEPSDEDIERDFITRPTFNLDAQLGLMSRNFVNDNVSLLDTVYNELAGFLVEEQTIARVPDPETYLSDQYLQMISMDADMREFAYAGYTGKAMMMMADASKPMVEDEEGDETTASRGGK